eukprot:6888247-Alexandrium_andersonii.AAC.1
MARGLAAVEPACPLRRAAVPGCDQVPLAASALANARAPNTSEPGPRRRSSLASRSAGPAQKDALVFRSFASGPPGVGGGLELAVVRRRGWGEGGFQEQPAAAWGL